MRERAPAEPGPHPPLASAQTEEWPTAVPHDPFRRPAPFAADDRVGDQGLVSDETGKRVSDLLLGWRPTPPPVRLQRERPLPTP